MLVALLGVFSGPIISSAFAWANCYIEVTAAVQMIAHIGAAVGDVAVMSAMGYSYEVYGPYVVWDYLLGMAVGMVAIVWIGQFFGSCHEEKKTVDGDET